MKGKLFQLQTALASSFGQLTMGLLNVWPSYTSSVYSSNETPLSEPMTTAEESLLGSLPSLGAMFGTAIVGVLIDRLGRRNGGLVIALPFVISWAMVSATTSKMVVLAARFLGGMAGGATLAYGPVFISEVAEDSFRGTLASGPMLMYCTGTLLSYILGWTLTYRPIIWVNMAFSVVLILLIMSVKESPVFLIKQNRDEEACVAIAHYRGVSPSSKLVLGELAKLNHQLLPPVELISVSTECINSADHLCDDSVHEHILDNIVAALRDAAVASRGSKTKDAIKADLKVEEAEKEKLNTENVEPEEQKKISPFKLLFLSPTSRRAFVVVATTMAMQVLMGIVPVQVFAKKVFATADPAKSDLYTVIFALVLTSGCLVPAVIADKVGRRILLITSSVLSCCCLIAMGYLIQSAVAPPWVVVLIIMLYCFSFMAGAGSVPYLLLAEVFISEVQNLASMIIVEWVWFLNFAIIGVFPFMNRLLGIYGTFYCFAVMAVTNAILCYFTVPETKGLSNEQIQELFMRRKKNK